MNEYKVTARFRHLILRKELQKIGDDKSWVSQLLWDLRRHYLSVIRAYDRPLSGQVKLK